MKRLLLILVILISGQVGQSALSYSPATEFVAQESPVKHGTTETIIGEVINIDTAAREAIIKTDQGATLTVKLDSNAICQRLPLGETTLDKAVPVQFADIAIGYRVLSRGLLSEDKKQLQAHRLIVVSKADIAKKRESDLDQWTRRGIAGVVRDLKPQTHEISLEVRQRGGLSRLVVTTQKSSFRRYASGSASFGDAKPSSFNELKVGDQLRALGELTWMARALKPSRLFPGRFRLSAVWSQKSIRSIMRSRP